MKIFRFATVFSVIFLNGFFLLSTFLPKINARQSISAFPLSDNKNQSAVKYQLIKPIRDEEIRAETNLNLLLLGLLRKMKLPTTPTLKYLRNRKYGIGDYQRSHNQAIFLKDMLIEHNQI